MKLTEINKIAVFRALQIGDMLCAIPAIRALKNTYPAAEITLIGLPWAKMLAAQMPQYFHQVIPFPGYPGFPEQPVNHLAFPEFLRQVQQQNFDLAIQMHGAGTISNPLVALFGAKRIAGFYTKGNFCPNGDLFVEYPTNLHEIERHLKLTEVLGVTNASKELEFPITQKDRDDLEKANLPVEPGKYVVIHPGSRGEARRWEPANFAKVADYCCKKGMQVVITGTNEEAPIAESVVAQMNNTAINAAGKTSLGAVALLIQNAAALVSNCTGVSHIAAALKTKSVVISMDGEPIRWGPLNKKLHHTIDWTTNTNFENVITEVETLLFK